MKSCQYLIEGLFLYIATKPASFSFSQSVIQCDACVFAACLFYCAGAWLAPSHPTRHRSGVTCALSGITQDNTGTGNDIMTAASFAGLNGIMWVQNCIFYGIPLDNLLSIKDKICGISLSLSGISLPSETEFGMMCIQHGTMC